MLMVQNKFFLLYEKQSIPSIQRQQYNKKPKLIQNSVVVNKAPLARIVVKRNRADADKSTKLKIKIERF